VAQNNLVVEPLSDTDLPAVIALWHACNLVTEYNDPADDIGFARGKPNSEVLVGRLEGALVASVMVGHDGHRGWLYYVAVDPSVQKGGFGAQIVRGGEDWLRRRGVPKAMLLIRETNAGVRAFYERIGYEAAPRIVMQRWL
jgi:GNAT superfamily N-acetyltransferase